MDYNNLLDELFERWIERSKENNEPCDENGNVIFTKDGLVEKNDPSNSVSEEWKRSEKRIMFLLKDQPTSYCDDVRFWLKELEADSKPSIKRKASNRNLNSKFIHNIANLFYGLSNARKADDCWLGSLNQDDVKSFFNKSPFALLECKKQGGTTKISDQDLQKYLIRYGDLLREEIKILNPNIIVCTNHHIYGFVLEMFPQSELKAIEGRSSIRIQPQSGTIILCSYHPSSRKSYEDFYEGVMWHYREYLRVKE